LILILVIFLSIYNNKRVKNEKITNSCTSSDS
jgi:hypothetical protein